MNARKFKLASASWPLDQRNYSNQQNILITGVRIK